jgi:archaellum component FlaC
MSDTESWALLIPKYRNEEPIVTILQTISKPRFVIDSSIETELKNYFIFVQKGELKPRSIRGPADYETALEIFEEIQTIKDRVSEMQLTYASINNDLERLWELAKAHIILKPEIVSAKSDTIRLAVLTKTISELEEVKKKVATHLKSTEILTKNLNQTYNIVHSQVETIKQMVYWRSLTLPTDKQSNPINRG